MKTPLALRCFALASVALIATAPAIFADNSSRHRHDERLVNLRGSWRFSIGDDLRWAKTDFDDADWSRVRVPNYWEDEGYQNYNGFAWYRREFTFDHDANELTYLLLGQIDDADEVYLNGKKIGGAGSFPPNYVGAWNQDRVYALRPGSLHEGENIIAIRVYDGASGGGIVGRSIGIYSRNIPRPEIDLVGQWKFHAGDDPKIASADYDDSRFAAINVPSYWESAGQGDLDGFGWYRKSFRATPRADDTTMVLMLGKIDDTDEVYLNGTKIGGTGNLNASDRHSDVGYHDQNRGYYFPASLLKEENVLAVRVHDHGGRGGIYEGPLGIISQNRYIEYWERSRANRRRDLGNISFRLLFGDED
jgi:sialate O-acetylesterase